MLFVLVLTKLKETNVKQLDIRRATKMLVSKSQLYVQIVKVIIDITFYTAYQDIKPMQKLEKKRNYSKIIKKRKKKVEIKLKKKKTNKKKPRTKYKHESRTRLIG